MTINWIGWILSLVILLLLFLTRYLLQNSVHLLFTGKRAKGIVVGMDSSSRFTSEPGKAPMLFPMVEFVTSGGECIRVSGRSYSSTPSARPHSEQRRSDFSEKPHNDQRSTEFSGKPRGEFKPRERRDDDRRRQVRSTEKPKFMKKPSASPSTPPASDGNWRNLMASMEEDRGGIKKKLKRLFIRDKT